MRTDLRLSRRSFLLASLIPLPLQPRHPHARMTIAEGWDWLFRWCGLAPSPGLPAAA